MRRAGGAELAHSGPIWDTVHLIPKSPPTRQLVCRERRRLGVGVARRIPPATAGLEFTFSPERRSSEGDNQCFSDTGRVLEAAWFVMSHAVRAPGACAVISCPRAALLRGAAAVPMPRSGRLCRAGCSESAWDTPAATSCAELGTARRETR